jgi:2-iminobutanoate/2-iminopropanoate deaminase
MRVTIQSDKIPAPRFRYSPCVKIGNTYHVSGMIGLDYATGKLALGGVGEETKMILANLLQALPDYGLSLDELLVARIFTTKFEEFAAINAAWEAVFSEEIIPPARTSVGVSALPLGAAVEIEFTFIKA